MKHLNNEPRYSIGTTYKTRGKNSKICTVVDILKTYNSKNELVQIRYISTHEFLGQLVINRDIPETTIAMGLIDEFNALSLINKYGVL